MDSEENSPSQRNSYANADHDTSVTPRNPQQNTTINSSAKTSNGPPPKTATGINSEHGHTLSQIEPMAKHSGSSVAIFFNGLFQTILAISTLGASITFNYVLSNSNAPNSSIPSASTRRFSARTVQLFLAVSWLLFLLALASAALGSTLLTFFRKHWEADWDGKRGKTSQTTVQLYAVFASGVMGSLVVGAFVLLCLVVVAYEPTVGWIALGFTSFFGLIMMVSVANQVPWPWRDDQPKTRIPKHVTV
jgi:hypothetical protein